MGSLALLRVLIMTTIPCCMGNVPLLAHGYRSGPVFDLAEEERSVE